jgi:putative oxidoreductase
MSVTEIALIAGRVLFALLFISSGINHFTKNEAMTGYAKYKKVPMAKAAVYLSGLMILLGGIYIVLGFYADLGALLIALFLIPTAFLMHAFWKETDPTAKQNETIGFFKDLSLAGAALIIFALLRGGADFGSNVGTLLFFS